MLPNTILDGFNSDNFTPRDFQVELFEAAKRRNTIACLKSEMGKWFVAVMLIREKAFELSRLKYGGTRMYSVYLTPTVSFAVQQSAYLRHHTPLRVGIFHEKKGILEWDQQRWEEELNKSQVLVMTYSVYLLVMDKGLLNITQINLLVIDECHCAVRNQDLIACIKSYESLAPKQPKILSLTSPVVTEKCKPNYLAHLINYFEDALLSVVQTSNSILSALQFSCQPRELICEAPLPCSISELEGQITDRILPLLLFVRDHRYDPTEYYGDQDYLKEIPNPCDEPLSILEEFLEVVRTFGPWGADRAALIYLIYLEKLKTRAVYERHYLLLCLIFTAMLEVRALCEETFKKYSDYERIEKFSRPKILRLLDILRLFRPTVSRNTCNNEANNQSLETGKQSSTCVESGNSNTETSADQSDTGDNTQQISRQFRHPNRRRRTEITRFCRNKDDAYQLCGIIFAEKRITAKLLYHLLKDASRCDTDLTYLSPLYTVDRVEGMSPKEVENEERKQEDVMKRFRCRDCNVLVATSILEEGVEVPPCHLIIRFDLPRTFNSYVNSKARARARKAFYILMAETNYLHNFLGELSEFHAIEQILLQKSGYHKLTDEALMYTEEDYNHFQVPYSPTDCSRFSATLQNSIAIINRYAAKLPSDCFTRLTPIWEVHQTGVEEIPGEKLTKWLHLRASDNCGTPCFAHVCALQLPINSPLRETIFGLPMPSDNLAKRSAALVACKLLHQLGELDNNFFPVGKDNLKLEEEENYSASVEDEIVSDPSPRPGTTKRRQYYYKQVAEPFVECLPGPGKPCFLYAITMTLTEPIPEEQNTRGRKIYKPENSLQSFGILSRKPLSQICPFPIFTRSGEVEVDVVEISHDISVSEEQLEHISYFQRYIFKNVLSLEKDPMVFDALNANCSYLIVPLRRTPVTSEIILDYEFVTLISSVRDAKPSFIPDEERTTYVFQPQQFVDAVVMRWYRDQEHPQCFYVAEIFYDLNPQSKFPDNNYPTFEKYYREKYGIQIQNLKQPLLDVDHTSARLNFLTPRYVNRKGVMLPTSSEHTKRTQRESLQQKQILIPELCTIHPFSASLWRQAVCLPCILYRLNGLLLAEQLRSKVAAECCLGRIALDSDFRWPALRFGWKRKMIASSPQNEENIRETQNGNVHEVLSNAPKLIENVSLKPILKEPKPSKNSVGCPLMDIGVWNPDVVNEAPNEEPQEGGDEDYDYQDLQAVSLLTNENGEDFDWTKTIPNANNKTSSLPTFNVGGDNNFKSWSHSISEHSSSFRPKSPSEFVDNYSDAGSYNSDPSFDYEDDETESDFDGEGDGGHKIKEFGPKLVCKGDTAEAIEEPTSLNMKKWRTPEEEEIEESSLFIEEKYEAIDELLSLEWEKNIKMRSPELERECEELLQSHKQTLIENYLVQSSAEIPITPPFLSKTSASEVLNRVEATTEMAIDSASKLKLLASASPHLAKLTALLLGNSTDIPKKGAACNRIKDDIIIDKLNSVNDDCKISETSESKLEDSYEFGFSFDEQPDLDNHPGPSPSVILQAFTMSSANDGINLERLETIGDSFLKYAITTYLYCKYNTIHEGKLSFLRSRQVSNLHLYQLGKKKMFGGCMIATKFNPHDNWLPPGYVIPDALEEALISSGIPLNYWNVVDLQGLDQMSSDEVKALIQAKTEQIMQRFGGKIPSPEEMASEGNLTVANDLPRFVPYNLLTQHSIPDKSIADCVEALIGGYLTACGPRGALLFMSWLGLKVLPQLADGTYGYWTPPVSPVLNRPPNADQLLEEMLAGFESFEERINYTFNDRFYLLQAFSHASYYPNRLTDCYQRLEFLGDAVLDYLITRYLYEDPRQHPPGALTDLRSALVNNTTFAILAVRYDFHRYFKHFSHTLNQIMERFIKAQEENGHCINEEYYLIEEGESEEAEDVEVPKALGDVFESVAGAIYLDSGMSLDAVWKVYYGMMKNEIDEFTKNVPKSPVRELLELETDRVKFGKAERLPDGRVRVTVDVIGKGTFKGIGRNYRIAKCTAAKFALRTLEKRKMLAKRGEQ